MEIDAALRIVVELAEQNALEPDQEEGPLKEEALRQWEAINMIREAFL